MQKLIIAIVSNEDSTAASRALTKGGFSVTRLATTGGFLLSGNTSFNAGMYANVPVQVTVGGATIFVIDVERYEKL